MTSVRTDHPVPKLFLRRPMDIHTHMILKKKKNNRLTSQLLYLETAKTTEKQRYQDNSNICNVFQIINILPRNLFNTCISASCLHIPYMIIHNYFSI